MSKLQGRPLSVLASFYRGGTSRGLFFAPRTLAPFHPRTRDAILCAALGSPDPDLRQISGLGGGLSSLSKIALVGSPDPELAQRLQSLGSDWELPGVSWADDAERARDEKHGWDCVYRFGQVPVTGPRVVDWSSTCGNLVAAAAQFAIDSGAIPQHSLHAHFERLQGRSSLVNHASHSFVHPVRILAADSGKIVRALVPIAVTRRIGRSGQDERLLFYPARAGTASIAGVPGTAAPVLIESPLESGVLPSGNARDVIKLDGDDEVEVTLISTGLPTIFVPLKAVSASLDPSILLSHPAKLDSHPDLHPRLEKIRQATAAQLLKGAISPSAPKICIIAPRQGMSYKTTGGERVDENDMDLLIRPVSVGNFHRTVPATTLSALAAGSAYPQSTISEAIRASPPRSSAESDTSISTLTVGHCAGTASASVRVVADNGEEPVPEAIIYTRTARRIMHGWVDLPAEEEPLDPADGDVRAEQPGWTPDPRWYGTSQTFPKEPTSTQHALDSMGSAGARSLLSPEGTMWNGVLPGTLVK
ncbi:hypothetical protein OC846_002654 [Tilletia horrida]|uniref:DUF453-domain-containing protein n=1 Tax=Tilletia horrida TaxID=155126 RepID=A0AAN6JRX9_9BASI|nr:hypothetical protein OC846_002654 [Tilletia horrida]KAK0569724.1 hypothetical protein OC861_000686 [Tilletia horrida]